MMADQFDQALEKAGTGIFISLKDKEAVEGVFVGSPYVFFQNFKTKEVSEEAKEGFTFKFKINFAVKAPDGSFSMKILQGPKAMAKDVSMVLKEYGEANVFKIVRQGEGKTTAYSVMFKANVTEPDKLLIGGLKQLSLKGNVEQA